MLEENQIVDQAQKVMENLSRNNMVTTSQIRRFLTAVNAVTEKVNFYKMEKNENHDRLPPELQAQVKYLKVKLAYQIGRHTTVKYFEKEAKLMEEIDDIKGSIQEYEKFAHYVEALVAFHKFYGGEN